MALYTLSHKSFSGAINSSAGIDKFIYNKARIIMKVFRKVEHNDPDRVVPCQVVILDAVPCHTAPEDEEQDFGAEKRLYFVLKFADHSTCGYCWRTRT
mgnify:FL=1